MIVNYLKPDKEEDFSANSHKQVDCNYFRFKDFSFSFHKEPMGRGTGKFITPKILKWDYPTPNSVDEMMLKRICSR